jgi:hypothetical protein
VEFFSTVSRKKGEYSVEKQVENSIQHSFPQLWKSKSSTIWITQIFLSKKEKI